MHLFPKVASLSAAKLVTFTILTIPLIAVSTLVISTQTAIGEHRSPPSSKKQHVANQKRNVSVEVTKTLQAQAESWNAGDLNKFMSSYLKSPDITFVSADGEMKGYDALESRYRKKYGTSRDTMGKLSFSDLEIQSLGESNALCVGHWLVERAAKPSLQGIFSLVLTEDGAAWKIIHDHTSLSQTPASK